MNRLKVLLSLITESNDYQQEQAKVALATARRLGIDLRTIFSEGDAIRQSQQLLEQVQSKSDRPDAIVFEPAGTGLAVVAQAAVTSGIAWVVMNRDVDYLTDLRRLSKAPCFVVSTNHLEVGRIQGRQIAALVPTDASVLYIQGPVRHLAAQQRTEGACETKPAGVQLRALKGNWTERSGYEAITSWLRLSTSHNAPIAAVVAHNDDMAIGARNAFRASTTGEERNRWLHLPFLGCDGLPGTGQTHVGKDLLQATVRIPAIAGQALEMLVHALGSGVQPPERTLTVADSFPSLENLAKGLKTARVVVS
jgi:ribose transport system substrate-binding protein